MKDSLTAPQVLTLKHLDKSQKDRKKADRIKIILLLNKGYTQKEVADILLLDEDTITKWKNCFSQRTSAEDLSSWLSDNYVAYVGKISYCAITRLRKHLDSFNVPTKAIIKAWLYSSEQINYSLSGLQKLLHRIGIVHKKIRRLPGKADVIKQASFIDKIHTIMSEVAENQTIMYIDSVHPQYNTVFSNVWIEKGTERWICSNTGRERVNINGAYNPFTQEVIIEQDSTITAQTTIRLFKKIIENNPHFEKIYIVSDNARYNKCKEIEVFLKTQNKIQMLYLPPYSPNLNLIERLWKFMNEKVIYLKYYDSFYKFKNEINSFFGELSIYKQELKSRITFNFQTFDKVQMAIA